jgi:hypothetical protein
VRACRIGFKIQKDGEPVRDQTTIDRLWVTTQREAMIESGPPSASNNPQQPSTQGQTTKKEESKK